MYAKIFNTINDIAVQRDSAVFHSPFVSQVRPRCVFSKTTNTLQKRLLKKV